MSLTGQEIKDLQHPGILVQTWIILLELLKVRFRIRIGTERKRGGKD